MNLFKIYVSMLSSKDHVKFWFWRIRKSQIRVGAKVKFESAVAFQLISRIYTKLEAVFSLSIYNALEVNTTSMR